MTDARLRGKRWSGFSYDHETNDELGMAPWPCELSLSGRRNEPRGCANRLTHSGPRGKTSKRQN